MLRTLPRRVTPALNETVDCYLRRLSEENFFYHTELVDYVQDGIRDAPIRTERLAAITGLPAKSLRCAMLELCTPSRARCRTDRGKATAWRPIEHCLQTLHASALHPGLGTPRGRAPLPATPMPA